MKIIQSTWGRFHHFDLARELNKKGYLGQIFTALPWWKAREESEIQNIPIEKISCNFLLQGIRRVSSYIKLSNHEIDSKLAEIEVKFYSKWIESKIEDCDGYIGISGTGLNAGIKVKKQGGIYIMDRGSTHIRHADMVLTEEYEKWGLSPKKANPWLLDNADKEAEEANIITVPSHYVKKTFLSQGIDGKKVKVIPYGVDLREFFPGKNKKQDGLHLVFVGHVSVRKGFLYLLDAFNLLNYKNKKLTVVGSIEKELQLLIKRRNLNDVEFIGNVPRNKVRFYMSNADALVLPSIEEGLALVQLQAMACGCPVIATPETGSESLFENEKHGLIIPSKSVKFLLEALERLIDEPTLSESMSVNCIAHSKKQAMSWTSYGDSMVEIIKKERSKVFGNVNE